MNILLKSLKILNSREKRTGSFLLFLTILKGIAETIGVASILPFLSILGQPELVETNPYASRVYHVLGFTSVSDFLFVLGVLVTFTIILSAVLKTSTIYATNRWVEMRAVGLSCRLLRTYLRQKYSYFLTRNTSKMGNSILTEAPAVAYGIYRPIINLFSAVTTFILISLLLLWANPLITIMSVLAIGISYLIFYACLRSFIKQRGQIIVEANRSRFRGVNETFAGIKQVKLSSLENFALERFASSSKDFAQAKAISTTLSQIPKFGLEVIAFGGIVALTLVLFKQTGGSIEKSLPLLGLYALAGYRLLPVFQSIFNSVATLRMNIPVIESVYEDISDTLDITDLPQSNIEPMKLNKSISLEAVHYSYPENSTSGLQEINLEILKGESLGVVGATGAGKTTFVDVLLGLHEVKQGSIFIDDVRLETNNVRNWQASVGYVPQDIFLSDASVAENIAIGIQKSQISPEKLESAAKVAKLYDFIITELSNGFDTLVGERGVRLSGGQRQRLGIARALYTEPQILIFDEATSALDTETERELISEISQMGGDRTIIMIAHRLSTIKNCDHILVLDKGKIIGKGKYKELAISNSKFRKLASLQDDLLP